MEKFEKLINYNFKNPKLLKQAFTHSSFAHEHKMSSLENNERLEFLGDAVLELIISEYLYQNFPDMPEGELTKFRASIVCESSLAKNAMKLDMGKFVLLGKGEENTGGRTRESILADAFEAVIGAIFLDGGHSVAKKFIIDILYESIEQGHDTFKLSDCKTYLQELLQKSSKEVIRYYIVDEYGPDHNKVFVAEVNHSNYILGKGMGKSKKEAEQNAAYNAIKNLEIDI